MLTLCTAFNAHLDNLFLLLYADGPWFVLTLYAAVSLLVHRFVNNYTIHLPAHSDSQASEWYSYFENNVLVTNHEGMDKIVIDIAMEIAPIIADGGCLSFICDV